MRAAVEFDVGALRVNLASQDDIIRSKCAANRAKDLAALPLLEQLRQSIEERRIQGG